MPDRLALIIANSSFEDSKLSRLVTPSSDANSFASVLGDPDLGGFEVTSLIDESGQVIRREIANLYQRKKRRDLILLYYSGHGIKDDHGDLFLAVKDTEFDVVSATAIDATFIQTQMDKSNSQRKVVILDCCHSGAFGRGAKAASLGSAVGTQEAFAGSGFGRIVLTASNALEYAWEGNNLLGDAKSSVFTRFLVEGIKKGKADIDGDGEITVDELYDYAYEQTVTGGDSQQTPQKWTQKVQGQIVLSKNPEARQRPVELPEGLKKSVEDSRPWVREGAVKELERLLLGNHPGTARAAYAALSDLLKDDSRRISSAVSKALSAYSRQPPITPVKKSKPMITARSQSIPAEDPAGSARAADTAAVIDDIPTSDSPDITPPGFSRPQSPSRRPSRRPLGAFVERIKNASSRSLVLASVAGAAGLILVIGLVVGFVDLAPQGTEISSIVETGRIHFENEEYDQAIDEYTRAIQQDPGLSEAYFERGKSYVALDDQQTASRDFTQAIDLGYQPLDQAFFNRGLAYYQLQEYRPAIEDFTETINLAPMNSEAFYHRAMAYEQLPDYDAAILDYSTALELNSSYAAAAFGRASAHYSNGQYDLAASDDSLAIELEYSPIEYAYINRGIDYLELEDYSSAISDFTTGIELDPGIGQAYYERSRAYWEMGDYKKVLDDVEKAIELEFNPKGLSDYQLARAHHKLENDEAAISAFTAAIESGYDPASVALYWRGSAHYNRSEFEEALADYDRAIELDPDDEVAFYWRALVHGELGMHDLAISDYTDAIDLGYDPASRAFGNRSLSHLSLDDYDATIADSTRALDLGYQPAAWMYQARGQAYLFQEDYEIAISDFGAAIEANYDPLQHSYYMRGRAYSGSGDYDKAISDFDQAISFDPSYTNAYYRRAIAQYNIEAYEQAIADYSKSLELGYSNLDSAHFNRGLAYEATGNVTAAIDDYELVLQLTDEQALAERAQSQLDQLR